MDKESKDADPAPRKRPLNSSTSSSSQVQSSTASKKIKATAQIPSVPQPTIDAGLLWVNGEPHLLGPVAAYNWATSEQDIVPTVLDTKLIPDALKLAAYIELDGPNAGVDFPPRDGDEPTRVLCLSMTKVVDDKVAVVQARKKDHVRVGKVIATERDHYKAELNVLMDKALRRRPPPDSAAVPCQEDQENQVDHASALDDDGKEEEEEFTLETFGTKVAEMTGVIQSLSHSHQCHDAKTQVEAKAHYISFVSTWRLSPRYPKTIQFEDVCKASIGWFPDCPGLAFPIARIQETVHEHDLGFMVNLDKSLHLSAATKAKVWGVGHKVNPRFDHPTSIAYSSQRLFVADQRGVTCIDLRTGAVIRSVACATKGGNVTKVNAYGPYWHAINQIGPGGINAISHTMSRATFSIKANVSSFALNGLCALGPVVGLANDDRFAWVGVLDTDCIRGYDFDEEQVTTTLQLPSTMQLTGFCTNNRQIMFITIKLEGHPALVAMNKRTETVGQRITFPANSVLRGVCMSRDFVLVIVEFENTQEIQIFPCSLINLLTTSSKDPLHTIALPAGTGAVDMTFIPSSPHPPTPARVAVCFPGANAIALYTLPLEFS